MVAVQIVWTCWAKVTPSTPTSVEGDTGLERVTHRQSLPNEYLVLLGVWDVVMILDLLDEKTERGPNPNVTEAG
eukprot:1955553-Prymnesium_polylepis.1